MWAPLGPGPLRAFLRSYGEHPAGADHELVIVLNGAGVEVGRGAVVDEAPLSREAVLEELRGTEHRLIELDRPTMDLTAYGHAARLLEHPRVCFLNSYSVILMDGWLGHLAAAAESPGVGLAGATGSWESRAELVPGGIEHRIYQLVKLREKRREYQRFPNPHIRTTAFMLERSIALEMDLERAQDKSAAYLLESGRDGITNRIQARGLRAVVVGRDGRSYDVSDWPRSGTFRSYEQRNLLVADNRTEEWQQASGRQRRRLSRRAWGASLPSGSV